MEAGASVRGGSRCPGRGGGRLVQHGALARRWREVLRVLARVDRAPKGEGARLGVAGRLVLDVVDDEPVRGVRARAGDELGANLRRLSSGRAVAWRGGAEQEGRPCRVGQRPSEPHRVPPTLRVRAPGGRRARKPAALKRRRGHRLRSGRDSSLLASGVGLPRAASHSEGDVGNGGARVSKLGGDHVSQVQAHALARLVADPRRREDRVGVNRPGEVGMLLRAPALRDTNLCRRYVEQLERRAYLASGAAHLVVRPQVVGH